MIVCGALTLLSAARAQETVEVESDSSARVMIIRGGTYLGVHLDDVDADKARELGLDGQYGAVIEKVVKDSPAEQAGLQANDVVIGWNGTRVESTEQLTRLVRETPAGRTVKLDVIRNGSRMAIDATIGERKGQEFRYSIPNIDSTIGIAMGQLRVHLDSLKVNLDSMRHLWQGRELDITVPPHGMIFSMRHRGRMGVELQSVSPQLAKFFGAEQGALVSAVEDTSAAERAGLRAGDIITAIDGRKVAGPRDVARILGTREQGAVSVTVIRDKREQTIVVDLPERPKIPEMPQMPEMPMLPRGGMMAPFEGHMQHFELEEGDGPCGMHFRIFRNAPGARGGDVEAPEPPMPPAPPEGADFSGTPAPPAPPGSVRM